MTREYVIVVDSCSDLSKEKREAHQIRCAKMNIVKKLAEGDVEMPASLDWDLYTNKELFDWQRGGMKLKTTQVPNEEFTKVFGEILAEGKDVLYISCSSALSGSYNYSLIVRDELLAKNPEAKIVCVDSLCSSMGQGSMALDAAIKHEGGATLEEVESYLLANRLCYNQIATVETLSYLKDAGRVKASSAFFGNIFGVKPMIVSDANGANVAIKKVKGRKNSIQELVSMVKEVVTNAEDQTFYVVHADCIEDAEYLRDLLVKEYPSTTVDIDYLGPIVGISTGPGTLAVYVKGKKVEFKGA